VTATPFSLKLCMTFLLLGLFPMTAANADSGAEKINSLSRRAGTQQVIAGHELKTDQRGQNAISANRDPIRISLEAAALMAFENNSLLKVERLNPEIQGTFEDQEKARYDPSVKGSAIFQSEKLPDSRQGAPSDASTKRNELELSAGVGQSFSTGTEISGEISVDRESSGESEAQYKLRIGVSVTQALLKGRERDANLATLRQASIEADLSVYELRGFSEALLAQVVSAYWDYALALREIDIVEESLNLANQQLLETREMISVGKLAETELAPFQAEIALQRQGIINARSALASTRLKLLRLLNPPVSNLWNQGIHLLVKPELPDIELADVDTLAKVALRMRPDVNQARLELQKGELEVVKTKNGLLPQMDLFITLGKSGYADSFGGSAGDLTGDRFDFQTGVSLSYPTKNREATARYRRALLTQSQAKKALKNLEQLVEMDVRIAYIEVNRAKQQLSATLSTRELQEEKLRAETEKFRVGRSTNLLVSQSQRDLLISRVQEVRAINTYLKALSDLFRLNGSLLDRYGISTEGDGS